MKYTIYGFQQAKLIENKLTNDDALILRLIKDMYSSAGMEFEDFEGIKFMWVNYTYFLNQIPIIGTKRNLMRKIEFYGEEFLLIRKLQKSKNGKRGNFAYIAPTTKLDDLQDYDKMSQGLGQNVIRVVTKCHNKDSSIKDTSNLDNKDIVEIIDYLNSKANTKYKSTSTKTQTLIKTRLAEGFTLEDFKTAITNKVAEWKGTEWEKFLRPDTLFSNKFEGYVNQKINKATKGKEDKFNSYPQREYDFKSLENNLLGYEKETEE